MYYLDNKIKPPVYWRERQLCPCGCKRPVPPRRGPGRAPTVAWVWCYETEPNYVHPTTAPECFKPIPKTIKTNIGYCGKPSCNQYG